MRTLALVLALAVAAPALARQRYGIASPEQITVAGQRLTLIGMGLRKKAFFKVYLASLYVTTPTTNAQQILAGDEVKRVELHMMRGVDKGAIVEAIRDGFQKNSARQMPQLESRLRTFEGAIPDLHDGDRLAFTWLPDSGLIISLNGTDRSRIPGKDFADALYSVWLGQNPVDDGLKAEMLTGPGKEQ